MGKKKNWILLLLVFMLFSCTKKAPSYNVVMIVIDTLRADHLSCYGYKEKTSPFIDSLAAKGTLFKHCYSASSWTAPSTASIFTSMYPFQHGVTLNMMVTRRFNQINRRHKLELNRIPKDAITIGEIMKNAGYNVYGFSDNYNIGDKEGFNQGFDHMETYSYKGAEFINKRILSFKDKLQKGEKPYFLYIQYMDVHQPNHEWKPWYKESDDKKKNTISRYNSELSYLDKKISELFKEFHWDENTLVIITADHGEELWDHGAKGHGYTLFKEVISVPLIFFAPNLGIAKQEIKYNVSSLDILPTLTSFVNEKKDIRFEGVDLYDILEGKSKGKSLESRYIFSHLVDGNNVEQALESFCVIKNHLHYFMNFSKGKYLFNLKLDPQERYNVIVNRKRKAELLKMNYKKFRTNCFKYKKNIVNVKIDKDKMKRLKTLGYIK